MVRSLGRLRGAVAGTILPRIEASLPAGTILELAPGYGRWSHYVREHCDRLVLVDLSEDCIEACRERFAGDSRIAYHVNGGTSLAMIEDGSIDFAFTCDSLVHAEAELLEEYTRVLAPDGAGFVHHSNAGEYRRYFEARRRLPRRLCARLVDAGRLNRLHRRALSVSAGGFRAMCPRAGLCCPDQELVNWGGRRLIDCFSTVVPASSARGRPARIVRNAGFRSEAEAVRRRFAAPSGAAP